MNTNVRCDLRWLPFFLFIVCIVITVFANGCKITSAIQKPKAPLTVTVTKVDVTTAVDPSVTNQEGKIQVKVKINNKGTQDYRGTLAVVSYDVGDKEFDKDILHVTIPPNKTIVEEAWVNLPPSYVSVITHWEDN